MSSGDPALPPNSIFICYRRFDSEEMVDRVYEALKVEFGAESIFRDINTIPPGVDFPTYIAEALRDCPVVLVFIGREWVGCLDERDRPRLQDPGDHVRIEVETALALADTRVIPVIVKRAHMPGEEELPESLRPLRRRNGITIRSSGFDYQHDVAQLAIALRQSVAAVLEKRRRTAGPERPPLAAEGGRPAAASGDAERAGTRQEPSKSEPREASVRAVREPVAELSSAAPPAPAAAAGIPAGRREPEAPRRGGRRGFVIFLSLAVVVLGLGFAYFRFGRRPADGVASTPAAATQATPFVNSLGMKFVPAGTPGVLFSIWDTRVNDFEEFIRESGYDMSLGEQASTLESDGKGSGAFAKAGGDWRDPHFPKDAAQTGNHPVVCVSWADAMAFCAWLTKKERAAGVLSARQSYRLPRDHEWSAAVGIGDWEDANALPESKSTKITGVHAWGTDWPPTKVVGNFAGEEMAVIAGWPVIAHYADGYARTSPVGSFKANRYGLYDMAGNVWQWCKDRWNASQEDRVVRGGAWDNAAEINLLSSCRYADDPLARTSTFGFRCVLVVAGGSEEARSLRANGEAKSQARVAEGTTVPATTAVDAARAIVPAAATKDAPFVNSLGMKFVPAGTPGVLFSIWDTRVKDFERFIQTSGYDMSPGEQAYSLVSDGQGAFRWDHAGGNWRDPKFPKGAAQTGLHPVVCVSWQDAKDFCAWLTTKERAAGVLGAGQSYRLPKDSEWSTAVGIGDREDPTASPQSKNSKVASKFDRVYQWEGGFPPPKRTGNFAGEESGLAENTVIKWYNDRYVRTSPVGIFAPNRRGLYDMGGNVWQWCEDWWDEKLGTRVLRGSSWMNGGEFALRSSCRASGLTAFRCDGYGFRCVLVVSGE